MNAQNCLWPGCDRPGHLGVDAKPFCAEHEPLELARIVKLHAPEVTIGEDGRPTNRRWLNWFARRAADWGQGLSKAKIETRATDFVIKGDVVLFSIVRHPVGREVLQRWRCELGQFRLQLVQEQLVRSDYKQDGHGNFLCPECESVLDLTPGRARCSDPLCDFSDFHDHSL